MSELLPDTDLRALSAAMGARRELTLTRTLGGTTLNVCVRHAPAVWGVEMIVQVRAERGWRTDRKNCATMEELEECLKSM